MDDPSIFELDGNAQDGAPAGDDWATIHAGTDSALATTGIVSDPAGQTIFTGGSTKDDLDISGWLHSTGSVPDKNEITNAYAAAYDDGGDLAVYFGLDKFSVNGNSNVGFWFLQNSIPEPLPANGTFGISHEVGDVLVLSEFTNGGDVAGIAVYQWVGSGGDTNGTLDLLAADDNADCTDAGHDPDACGVSNQGNAAIDSPWPYTPKSGAANKFARGAFFEGGVNLTSLFPGGTPCFSSFMAETRSSQSVDAVLKDFAVGSFPLCDAAIQISGAAINEVGDDHVFTVNAQKILGGSPSAADDGTIVDVDLTAADGALVNLISDNCANPGTVAGSCTVTFDSATAGTITGHASAGIQVGDTTINRQTDGSGSNSGDVVKAFVDAKIALSPLTDTNGITENHVVTADVEVDTGGGFSAADDGHVEATVSGGAGTNVTMNAAGTTCEAPPVAHAPADVLADNLDVNGQCTVAFTSSSAGEVTVGATVALDIGVDLNADGDSTDAGETITVTRSTDGTTDDTDTPSSQDATKTFVDGQLRWLKVDDLGNPLGGATFKACRTHDYVSASDTFADIADVCVNGILDDSAPDVDSDAGELQLDDLVLGRWVITETAAPTGYALDPLSQTVDLTTASPNGQATNAFVNTALYKVIVLTCNTSTELLEVSAVDEDPGTAGGLKDTLAAGVLTAAEQNALCALGGASYDDKTGGTYRYDVTVPKP